MNYYFGTILLESNRWSGNRTPSYDPSDWYRRIKKDGYTGLELWENHAIAMDRTELERTAEIFPGTVILNHYDRFESETEEHRASLSTIISALSASGCKFNLGPDDSRLGEYKKNFSKWAESLPKDFRFICECHAGTVCEEPDDAARILDDLGDDRVEALIHIKQSPAGIRAWRQALGDRLTHGHINYMRLKEDPWTAGSRELEYDVLDSLEELVGHPFKSMTMEFTRGVGEPPENREKLYEHALRDRSMVEKKLKEPKL